MLLRGSGSGFAPLPTLRHYLPAGAIRQQNPDCYRAATRIEGHPWPMLRCGTTGWTASPTFGRTPSSPPQQTHARRHGSCRAGLDSRRGSENGAGDGIGRNAQRPCCDQQSVPALRGPDGRCVAGNLMMNPSFIRSGASVSRLSSAACRHGHSARVENPPRRGGDSISRTSASRRNPSTPTDSAYRSPALKHRYQRAPVESRRMRLVDWV